MRVTKQLSLQYHKAKTKFIYLRVFVSSYVFLFFFSVFSCLILQYNINTSDEQQVKFVFFCLLDFNFSLSNM